MARFPVIKMQKKSRHILSQEKKYLSSQYQNIFFKTLRNVSSAFIKRKDVRTFLLAKHNNQCCICGDGDNLQIDHIVSVKACYNGVISIKELNEENNLQVLCRHCNTSKLP